MNFYYFTYGDNRRKENYKQRILRFPKGSRNGRLKRTESQNQVILCFDLHCLAFEMKVSFSAVYSLIFLTVGNL